MREEPKEGVAGAPGDLFATTRWTMVLKAARNDTTLARSALAELCQTYWFPLYAYVRRRGYGAHDAEDLTQGFFARLLRLDSLGGIGRERGRFRAFLLASMKHYLSDERDRASARKREAGRNVSLDAALAEDRYGRETADLLTPERLFERQWALALLESVLQRLASEYEAVGKAALFDELRFALTGERSSLPYAKVGERLGMSEEAVRVAVHRLRRRYRRLLRSEVAQTVENSSEVADELVALRRILSR